MKYLLLFFCICAFSLAANAQTDSLPSSLERLLTLDLEQLIDMEVVSSSKVKESYATTTSTMMVITDQMIRDRGYTDLEEILHDIPGFDFNKEFGVNYSTIFMRGFRSSNSDRFILLFDGIWENDIWKQTTWISRQYPISAIKRIEILYGPASSLYGTNAFSGIINVITKEKKEVGQANLLTQYGSYGRKNVEFSAGDEQGNMGYNISFKYFDADKLHSNDALDFDKNFTDSYKAVYDRPYVWMDGGLKEVALDEQTPTENYGVHTNLYWGNLKFTALNWVKREPEGFRYNPVNRRGIWTQWYENNQGYQLSHKLEPTDRLQILSNLMYRHHRLLDSKELTFKFYDRYDPNNPDTEGIDITDPSTYKIRLISPEQGCGSVTYYNLWASALSLEEQINYKINDKIQTVNGLRLQSINTQEDYNSGATKESIKYTPRHLKRELEAYSQIILAPTERLRIVGGGRYKRSRDENNNGFDIFVPRVSAAFSINHQLSLRAQYSQAFQEPDDWRKFATSPERPNPSPNLNPEKISCFELGSTYRTNKVLIQTSLYSNYITDLITEVADEPGSSNIHYENVGSAKINGYELMSIVSVGEKMSINMNVSGAFNTNQDGEIIGDIAPLKATLAMQLHTEKFTFFPKINYVSAKNTVNHLKDPTISPIVQKIDGYAIIGFFTRYHISKHIDINLKVDNLLNQTYYNPGVRSANGTKDKAQILQPGINFMGGLQFRW